MATRLVPKKPKYKQLKQMIKALKIYYSVPLEFSFKRFRAGLIYFTFGFIVIYLAHNTLEPSLKQEIITFIGILFIAVGFFMAVMAHIRMIISRIIMFINKK
ncbi:hypothetical protein [Agarilytica rhodophyticola]|uniref:hypothetical protein n=1 Tax=Agarilytica rhodophyticola TaxID=1737490 RepID=UPI001FE78DDC|nr:hypothetical protein [Agarilytica rhodophyticola]